MDETPNRGRKDSKDSVVRGVSLQWRNVETIGEEQSMHCMISRMISSISFPRFHCLKRNE